MWPWNAGAMQNTLTHYEQLNVARDATPEQIKRAYRKLAQQLHPDRNPAEDASELMSRVNASHEVLANPARRLLYDAQLLEQERRQQRAQAVVVQGRQGAAVYAAAAQAGSSAAAPAARAAKARPASAAGGGQPVSKRRRRRTLVRWVLLFMTFCAAGAWMGYDHNARLSYTPTEALPVYVRPASEPERVERVLPVSPPVPAEPECAVPALDPLGAAWPLDAGYLQGMPLLRNNGWSQIVVDNRGGDSAVYAKVTDAVGRNAFRHAYVPPGEQFSFARMDAGYYQLKYQMLKTGCVFATNRILLEETPMGSQVKSSVYRLTLSKLKGRSFAPTQLKLNQF